MSKKGLTTRENKIIDQAPYAPKDLSEKAAAHWNEIMPVLVADRVVCSIDIPLIKMTCEIYAKYLQAVSENDFKTMKDSIFSYKNLMILFGATHKARQSLKIASSAVKQAREKEVKQDFFYDEDRI